MASLGRFILFIGSMFVRRESFLTYVRLTIDECMKIGINSIFIVSIVSIFIGAVTTLQTAYNLVSPFIPPYVISLVVRDMTILELAPTVMAIVYAGKVGSNIASELGTMRISEQIDALEVMGINSASYLVLPKIIASFFTYPMLVVLSAFLSILGGYLAGTMTGTLTGYEYTYGIRSEFSEFSVTFALIKSFTFALVVAAISAYKGYFTNGGALEVGQASTAAVTNSCIGILTADFLLTKLLL
ncbi:phospholipid/cholesterol/gamma-HCH transport system permease protein [Reichenbachiella faecimaris]|uniref:Phospholipid/cholesterol/gamma-HCH transport system permease protein n=1 Tax=Reichenbachiella faecimaris TaxID=692418 RepID=A0A1W2G8V9_REIFA|nr:ABC transporter permease [Reichenbachiella faecimaris]SMD33130.1 phospholipid/cholesterol/gamma-HCH transport system permease protein [Reichenbachiella faecimaris]